MKTENRLSPNNTDILTRGKTIRTLLRELLSYKKDDVKVMCSLNEGETLLHINRAENITKCCMLICKKHDTLNSEEKTIKTMDIKNLVCNLKAYKNSDTEVRFSLDEGKTSKSIGLVGKVNNNCILMNLEEDE